MGCYSGSFRQKLNRYLKTHSSRNWLSSLLLLLSAHSGEALSQKASTVSIGTTHMPPYFIDAKVDSEDWYKKGEASGFILESITQILGSMGRQPSFLFLPLARAENFVHAKRLNCLSPVRRIREQDTPFIFSDPMPGGPVILLARAGTSHEITDLTDLKNYRIGAVVGDQSVVSILNAAGVNYETARTHTLNLQKLVLERVDLIAIDYAVSLTIILEAMPEYAEKVEPVYPPLAYQSIYLACHADVPENKRIIEDFNTGLNKLLSNGKMKEIAERYGLDDLAIESHIDQEVLR